MSSRACLIAALVVGCYIPPSRSNVQTTPGQTGGMASTDPSTPAEAAAPADTKFELDNGACDQNEDVIVEEGGAGSKQDLSIGSHASMEITIEPDHLPATLCFSNDGHNNCATNRAQITATTQKVIVSADCHSVHAE